MDTDRATQRFWEGLAALYAATGGKDSHSLKQLVKLGRDQQPPIEIGTSTINAWFLRRNVPMGEKSVRYFKVLVTYLEARVPEHSTYQKKSPDWWSDQLKAAQLERGKYRGGRPAEPRTSDPSADPGADFIRAVEDFVQQISGIRPDGFLGSSPAVADTAFAARAWEVVRQTVERAKITCPAAATHIEAVWETVTRFYGTYLEWAEPEGDENLDSMNYLRGPEPAGPEDLKLLGTRAGEALREPLGAFRERWRELH